MKANHSPTWQIDPKKKNRYVIRFPAEPNVHAGAIAYCSVINGGYFWTASVKLDDRFSYMDSGDASTIDQAFYDADVALHKLAEKTAAHYQSSK